MDLTSIPERGTLYALYLDKVKYEKYSRKELLEDKQLTEKLLELHLFNDTREYRYIKTRSGEIETLISDETVEHEDIYTEKIVTLGNKKEKPDKDSGLVEVVNYITYDELQIERGEIRWQINLSTHIILSIFRHKRRKLIQTPTATPV